MMVLLNLGEEVTHSTPPPVLSLSTQFVKIGEVVYWGEVLMQHTAPTPQPVVLPLSVQFVKLGEECSQNTPPPAAAKLPESVQFVKVDEDPSSADPSHITPPP